VKSVEILSKAVISGYCGAIIFDEANLLLTVMGDLKNRDSLYSQGGSALDGPIEELSDSQIMNILYGDFSSYIYSIIRSKIRSSKLSDEDIDDCFIDVIIRISENDCRRIRKFRGESSFRTYLTVLCINLATDFIRKETRNSERIKRINGAADDFDGFRNIDDDIYLRDNPEVQYLMKERESLIREARLIIERVIESLPHDERLLVSLRLKKNMTYREIDEFLGIENSRYRISGIIRKIRDAIGTGMRQSIEELFTEDEYGYTEIY
jgi:RNA polymerase sigma factor (sigma-70 family)